MAKKKKKTKGTWTAASQGFGKKNLESELRKAEARIVREQWSEASKILSDLGEQYPNEKRIWGYLTEVYIAQDDYKGYQRACEHWLEIDPNNGPLLYGLGFSYMVNQHPLLALQVFRRAIACQPDHEEANQVKETIPQLEAFAEEAKSNFEPDTEDWFELAIRHEQGQAYLEEGEYAKAREAELEVIERQPSFLAAYNNLSLIQWVEGETEEAIATAESVLDKAPNNSHALSNIIRFLSQTGNDAAAWPYAERLRTVDDPDAWNGWTKQVEGLSYLGDDAGIVEVYEQWQAAGEEGETPLFHHLVAVALARCDRSKEAITQWKAALVDSPNMTIAKKNLQEQRFPVGQQHGAWPFDMSGWLPPKTLAAFYQTVGTLANAHKASKLEPTLLKFFDQHPNFLKQAPRILERGGPEGQSFWVMTADQIQTPELMEAIKDFALGTNGTDQLRLQAATHAVNAGLLDKSKVRLWQGGEWREVVMMGFELHGEPDTGQHSAKVAKWQEQAVRRLHENTLEAALEAEALLNQALAAEPDSPDLLFNLTAAYMLSDRESEAEALIRDIHQRFPDYLFARTAMARIEVDERNFDAARELLKPLMAREKLHYSEFYNLMEARVELEMATGNTAGVESWINMWESATPDHPRIAYWKGQIRQIKSGKTSPNQEALDKLLF